MVLPKIQLRAIRPDSLRAIARGKFKGIKSTEKEKSQAKMVLKERGLTLKKKKRKK